MKQDGFYDRNHRYSHLVACENARRIAEDPEILKSARRHLDRFSRDDPHQKHGYALWSVLLDEGSSAVIARLTERSERGDCAADRAVLRRALGAGQDAPPEAGARTVAGGF